MLALKLTGQCKGSVKVVVKLINPGKLFETDNFIISLHSGRHKKSEAPRASLF
jgi:hypothetical protein